MSEDIEILPFIRLVNVENHVLHLVVHMAHHHPRTCWHLLVDARTLRPIRLAIFMLTIDRAKVI